MSLARTPTSPSGEGMDWDLSHGYCIERSFVKGAGAPMRLVRVMDTTDRRQVHRQHPSIERRRSVVRGGLPRNQPTFWWHVEGARDPGTRDKAPRRVGIADGSRLHLLDERE